MTKMSTLRGISRRLLRYPPAARREGDRSRKMSRIATCLNDRCNGKAPLGNRHPGQGCDDIRECCDEQRQNNASPKHQRDNGGCGEYAELPPLFDCAGERDRRAEDRADRSGSSGTIEERSRAAEPVETLSPADDEHERRATVDPGTLGRTSDRNQ